MQFLLFLYGPFTLHLSKTFDLRVGPLITFIQILKSFSGLLRVTSSPVGLTYDSNFISGTREEVISTYRATCCAPRVMVTAVDAFGNANSYVVDISSTYEVRCLRNTIILIKIWLHINFKSFLFKPLSMYMHIFILCAPCFLLELFVL